MTGTRRNRTKTVMASLGVAAAAAGLALFGAGVASAQERPQVPEGDQVCLFHDADYSGVQICGNNTIDPQPGEVYRSGLEVANNDQISSIRVKPGYTVRLWTDAFQQGRSLDITGDLPDLGLIAGEFAGFNDQVSSFELFVTPS